MTIRQLLTRFRATKVRTNRKSVTYEAMWTVSLEQAARSASADGQIWYSGPISTANGLVVGRLRVPTNR